MLVPVVQWLGEVAVHCCILTVARSLLCGHCYLCALVLVLVVRRCAHFWNSLLTVVCSVAVVVLAAGTTVCSLLEQSTGEGIDGIPTLKRLKERSRQLRSHIQVSLTELPCDQPL